MINENTIIEITNEEALSIIDFFSRKNEGKLVNLAEEREGMFLAPDADGSWTAIDNRGGDAWTENFKCKEVAARWLRDECPGTDEAHALDKLLSDPERVISVMGALFARVFGFEEDRVAEALEADGIKAEEAGAFGFFLPSE